MKIEQERKVRLEIRLNKDLKERWQKICLKRNISLTSLIIDSVEERIFEDDRRNVLKFIEKQDNIFVKIETNINQVAKTVNAQKFMSNAELKNFNLQLKEIAEMKQKQNEMIKQIYSMLANDS